VESDELLSTYRSGVLTLTLFPSVEDALLRQRSTAAALSAAEVLHAMDDDEDVAALQLSALVSGTPVSPLQRIVGVVVEACNRKGGLMVSLPRYSRDPAGSVAGESPSRWLRDDATRFDEALAGAPGRAGRGRT